MGGSAHGTTLDGKKLERNVPARLCSGACIRFGASSRIYMYREPGIQFDPSGKVDKSAPKASQDNLCPPEDSSPEQVEPSRPDAGVAAEAKPKLFNANGVEVQQQSQAIAKPSMEAPREKDDTKKKKKS